MKKINIVINKMKIRIWLSDIFYMIAVWLDPRLKNGNELAKWDLVKYGSHLGKRIDPRKFYINPK